MFKGWYVPLTKQQYRLKHVDKYPKVDTAHTWKYSKIV